MAFFNDHQAQAVKPGQGVQLDQRQMQQIAQHQLQDFGQNIDRYIDQSGIQFPQEIRGDIPAMCKWMLENNQVPNNRLRIAQPLINRLMGRR